VPAWIVAALSTIGRFLAGRGGAGIAIGTALPVSDVLGGAAGVVIDPLQSGLGLAGLFGGKEKVARRRRKRALTQSDRNDIAFIAATISKSAAGTFAVQLASRSR